MKRFGWLLAIFGLAVALWLSAIFIVPQLAKLALWASSNCPSNSITECKDILSTLGATGDTFGAITSLFSGLALFAVAYTVWSDADARREARKPLVTTNLGESSIVIREPKILPEPAIDFAIASNVSNRNGEAALNISVYCTILSGKENLASFTKHLSQPLVSDSSEEFTETIKLKGTALAHLLGRLTEDQTPVLLIFSIQYNSLENVRWETKVAYEIHCKNGDRRRRLNALRSSTDDFAALWENGAEVSLEARVKPGSWDHSRKPAGRGERGEPQQTQWLKGLIAWLKNLASRS